MRRTSFLDTAAAALSVASAAAPAFASTYSLFGSVQVGNHPGISQTRTSPSASLSGLQDQDEFINVGSTSGTMSAPSGMFIIAAHACSGGRDNSGGPAHAGGSGSVDISYLVTSATLPIGTPVAVRINWALSGRITAVGENLANINDTGGGDVSASINIRANEVLVDSRSGGVSRGHTTYGGITYNRTGNLDAEGDSASYTPTMLVGQTVRVLIQGGINVGSYAVAPAATDGDGQMSVLWGVSSMDSAASMVLAEDPGQAAPPADPANPGNAGDDRPDRPDGVLPCFHLPTQPAPATACGGGSAGFSVGVQGTGPFTYQWQIQTAPGVWRPLSNDPPTSFGCTGGASSGVAWVSPLSNAIVQVSVHPCPGVSHYQVRCVVTNPCGSITSDPATLTTCLADFDCNGTLAVADIFAFLNAWFAGTPSANFDGMNGLEVADIFAFLNAWFAGCG